MDKKLNKNIAMVAYTYYSTDPRVKKEAEALAGSGFDVDFFSLRKAGEPGLKMINGVRVYQLNCRHYKGKSNFRYLLSYISFFLRVFFKITYFYFKRKYSLVHINNMPDLLVFTSLIPKIFGAKMILDIHDVMSEVYISKNPLKSGNILSKILIFQERLSSKLSNYVIAVDEYHKNVISGHGIRPDKIKIISNFPDENLFKPSLRKFKSKKNFTLVFHGTISRVYGLETVIKGIKKACKEIPNLSFKLIGEGDYEKEIQILIKKLNLGGVIDFKNLMIPHEEIPQEIADSDLGIVSCPQITAVYQNKFLEYISMGIPVLIEYNDKVYEYYKDYNLEFYNRSDPDSFADRLRYLYHNKKRYNELKETSRELSKKFKWSDEKKKYIDLVDLLVSGSRNCVEFK
jgi:glycosyltransferase involved in cell wall biosynthesis